MCDELPVSLIKAEKLLGIHDKGIINYVVCTKCHSIYKPEECIIKLHNGKVKSKLCNHIKYPNHPHNSKRQPCNTSLMKEISSLQLRAIRSFPYCPLKVSLQHLVLQPRFLSSCEMWREREHIIPDNILGDVYDGLVWKSFRNDFLSSPYCYLFSINVDWFQPFKHTEYSVGAIYVTIQNLPREKRYKEENFILVGLIPGPKEPSLSIDSYLQPFIDELKSIYSEGLVVSTPQRTHVTIRIAVSCICCDIPATRKVSGFLSHNAKLGCNKCYKEFGISESYTSAGTSEYDRASWKLRTAEEHHLHCKEILSQVTKSGIWAVASKYGVRYCSLLQLPYYDPIKFVAIDLMHNLFLGTGKHMFTTWLETGLISNENLINIDTTIKNFVVPSNTGRLPVGLKSNHALFKASQWSSWILFTHQLLLKAYCPMNITNVGYCSLELVLFFLKG